MSKNVQLKSTYRITAMTTELNLRTVVMEKQRTEINRKEGIVARGEKVRRKSIGDEARDGHWKSYCIFHHKYFGFLSE